MLEVNCRDGVLKVLDAELSKIFLRADAQYREDVLVLAAVGVAVLTAFPCWRSAGPGPLENVTPFDQREDNDALGVAPTPQIGGEGWASELRMTSRGKLFLTLCHQHSGGLY